MIIGVPREIKDNEYRVAMTPGGVRQLTLNGHTARIEEGAGLGSGFSDDNYRDSGAEIVSAAEAWAAELVVKVKILEVRDATKEDAMHIGIPGQSHTIN